MMVSKRNLQTSRVPFSGSMLNFGRVCIVYATSLEGSISASDCDPELFGQPGSMGNPVAQRINIKSSTPSH